MSLSEQATWSDDLYVVGDDVVCMYIMLDGLLMAPTARLRDYGSTIGLLYVRVIEAVISRRSSRQVLTVRRCPLTWCDLDRGRSRKCRSEA